MKFEFSDLSEQGLVISPVTDKDREPSPFAFTNNPAEFFDGNPEVPELVGTVPNLAGFASGPDHSIGAFEIKAADSNDICLPDNIPYLLPATSLAINDLYYHAGPVVAEQLQVSLQFLRRNYEPGEKLMFDGLHNHESEGKMVIYLVTAVEAPPPKEEEPDRLAPEALGTEFYSPDVLGKPVGRPRVTASPTYFLQRYLEKGVVAAPGGAIIRLNEKTLHTAPDITHAGARAGGIFGPAGDKPLRRTLMSIIATYKQPDGLIYGRTRAPNDHRPTPVKNLAERVEEYRATAQKAIAQSKGKTLVQLTPLSKPK